MTGPAQGGQSALGAGMQQPQNNMNPMFYGNQPQQVQNWSQGASQYPAMPQAPSFGGQQNNLGNALSGSPMQGGWGKVAPNPQPGSLYPGMPSMQPNYAQSMIQRVQQPGMQGSAMQSGMQGSAMQSGGGQNMGGGYGGQVSQMPSGIPDVMAQFHVQNQMQPQMSGKLGTPMGMPQRAMAPMPTGMPYGAVPVGQGLLGPMQQPNQSALQQLMRQQY